MTPAITPDEILRLDRKVPRYTSYSTAADFNDDIDDRRYRRWLAAIPEDEDISLYAGLLKSLMTTSPTSLSISAGPKPGPCSTIPGRP